MFFVHVSSPAGIEAEFSIESATLALDLALRSLRAGLCWSAQTLSSGSVQPLSLTELREIATARAAGSAERELLDQVEWQHELHTSFGLN